jgi:hypothetical protein
MPTRAMMGHWAFAVVILALQCVGLSPAKATGVRDCDVTLLAEDCSPVPRGTTLDPSPRPLCPRDWKLVCDDPDYPDCYCVHSPRTAPPTHTPTPSPTETPTGSPEDCRCLENGGEPGPGDCRCNVTQCYHRCVDELCPGTPNCTLECSRRCTCESALPECPDHEDPGPTPTPVRTPISGSVCVGDCDENGSVSISELITGVSIALGTITSACSGFACTEPDGGVGISCLVTAVNNALGGCRTPSVPTATPTPTATITCPPPLPTLVDRPCTQCAFSCVINHRSGICMPDTPSGQCFCWPEGGTPTVTSGHCVMGPTPPPPTATERTPTMVPVPTSTDTAGLSICGRVQERPHETGYARGVVAVLTPPGTRARIGTGIDPHFCFEQLKPGSYVVTVAEQCNPFGCWPPVDVELADENLSVFLSIEPRPTPGQ